MKFVLICIILSFLNRIHGQEDDIELIAGHVVFRHGDRTPITTFPTDPVKPSDWPNGYGQLTAIGIEQQHQLGQFIRDRYSSLLTPNYTASEISVRSTDVDRTLMSAQANLAGLYPALPGSPDGIPIQPIPIHTVSIHTDFLLGQSDCPRYDQLEDEIDQSDEVQQANKRYETFLKQLELWTGLSNLTVYNAWDVADTIYVEHLYNRTPVWALNETVRKNLSDINEFGFRSLFSNNDTQRIRGGPVIQDMWFNMNSSVNGSSFKKFKMYSAHDTTVSAALAFLRVYYPHQPEYASALFIDLYRINSSYYVRVEYLNGTNATEADPKLLDGCPDYDCPFSNFSAIYKPRFPANPDVECRKKYPPSPIPNDNSGGLVAAVIIMAIIFAVLTIVIFVGISMRQNEPTPFPTEDEQRSICI